jgi:hypothetical protein
MLYSDLNIHLCSGDGLSMLLQDDFSLECPSLLERIKQCLVLTNSELYSANLMLFNQGLSVKQIESVSSFCSEFLDKKIHLTLLSSPTNIVSCDQLHALRLAGLSSITFHSYHQSITKAKYSSYAELASWANELKMPIFVDGSYGTLEMYSIDNLDFVACLASLVKNTPIVIMHSGGARILEAMLLVESTSNLFLETSFTLPYYTGSSVASDLAFAYKKLGPERVVYASDHPYVSHKTSLAATLKFLDKYNFSLYDQDWILRKTYSRIFASC